MDNNNFLFFSASKEELSMQKVVLKVFINP